MLKNGLNIKKKQQKPVAASRSAIFEGDSSDEGSHKDIAAPGGRQPQSSLRKVEVDEDDAIYDYDALYDSMKSGEYEAVKLKEIDKKERKPKYMQNLFQMAEVRKQDRLRAEDFKLERERELEGDEFADKEKFVTSAYRAQQEELKRVKAEEAEKEAKARSQDGGFGAFNRGLLENDRRKHDAAVEASLKAERRHTGRETLDEQDPTPAQLESDKIKQAEAKLGHKIAVNDDNQIVDHRQLLGAGLNRSTKSVEHLQTSTLARKNKPILNKADREERQAQIDRQQRVIDEQLRDVKKREADEEFRKQDAIKAQAKRTKTDSDVSSARERYLARKAAETAAKASTDRSAAV